MSGTTEVELFAGNVRLEGEKIDDEVLSVFAVVSPPPPNTDPLDTLKPVEANIPPPPNEGESNVCAGDDGFPNKPAELLLGEEAGFPNKPAELLLGEETGFPNRPTELLVGEEAGFPKSPPPVTCGGEDWEKMPPLAAKGEDEALPKIPLLAWF